jgi:hypothetical protein
VYLFLKTLNVQNGIRLNSYWLDLDQSKMGWLDLAGLVQYNCFERGARGYESEFSDIQIGFKDSNRLIRSISWICIRPIKIGLNDNICGSMQRMSNCCS